MLKLNKIYHGNCLKIMRDIPNKSIDCIITDPPYGIDYQSTRGSDKTKWKLKIANDKSPYTIWIDEAFRVLKNKAGLFCFTRWDIEQEFRKSFTKSNFICKQQIIWDKEIHSMGDLFGDFASQHENIIFATKGRFIFKGKRPKSVIRTQRVFYKKLLHPNEKPIDLIIKLIEAITVPGDVVLDLFAGSGTTGVACINTKRNYILIEKEEKYYKIAQDRLSKEDKKNTYWNHEFSKMKEK